MPVSISINPSIASLARPEGLALNLSASWRIFRRLAGLLAGLADTQTFKITTEVVAVASIFAATFIWIIAL